MNKWLAVCGLALLVLTSAVGLKQVTGGTLGTLGMVHVPVPGPWPNFVAPPATRS